MYIDLEKGRMYIDRNISNKNPYPQVNPIIM